MIVRTNEREIQVKSIMSEKMSRDGYTYPALRFEFENGVSAEDVAALSSGSFEVLDEEGDVIGTHEGYNTKGPVSVLIAKVTTADQEMAELQEALNVIVGDSKEYTRDELLELRALIEKAVNGLDDTEAATAATLFPLWADLLAAGYTFTAEDVSKGFRCQYNSELYKVIQPHTIQATWNPEDAPSLFTKVLIPEGQTVEGE